MRLAQEKTTYLIGGFLYPRVRYGKEDFDYGAEAGPCGDCAVVKGQFHVPSCDVERCPRCGFQVISYICFFDKYGSVC